MTLFANAADFQNPSSRLMALGYDLRTETAIVDQNGGVLAYAKTGGILNPVRHELKTGSVTFRFGSASAPPAKVAAGKWWIERDQLEKLVAFANAHGITLPVATRFLALVPPEWSDLSLLIRTRVRAPLLAWRGLGDSVIVRDPDGLGNVSLPHSNDIAARRLFQLFVPGLSRPGIQALTVEHSWLFTTSEALNGWLYL